MQKKNISHSVEAIETRADKLLNEARIKADNILLKANKDVDELLNSELLTDEVDARCHDIINKATQEADKKNKAASKQTSGIKVHADKNIEAIVERIVAVVTGAYEE